jgi:hypothetical protein
MFAITTKLMACLGALTQADLDELPPARRRLLAQTLAHWARKAETPTQPQQPNGGVLASLSDPSNPRHGS